MEAESTRYETWTANCFTDRITVLANIAAAETDAFLQPSLDDVLQVGSISPEHFSLSLIGAYFPCYLRLNALYNLH